MKSWQSKARRKASSIIAVNCERMDNIQQVYCYLEEGKIWCPMEVCDLQVAVDDLAVGVKESKHLVMVLQTGGQWQLHIRTQTYCRINTRRY